MELASMTVGVDAPAVEDAPAAALVVLGVDGDVGDAVVGRGFVAGPVVVALDFGRLDGSVVVASVDGTLVRAADVAEVFGLAAEPAVAPALEGNDAPAEERSAERVAAEVVAVVWPLRSARRGGIPLRRPGLGCTRIVATEAVGVCGRVVGVAREVGAGVGAGTVLERVGAAPPAARSAPGGTCGGLPAPKVHASTVPGAGEELLAPSEL